DVTWSQSSAGNGPSQAGSKCVVLSNLGITGEPITNNYLSVGPINMTGVVNPLLSFDVAYQQFPSSPDIGDSLTVWYSTNCGQTFQKASYKKGVSNQGRGPSD